MRDRTDWNEQDHEEDEEVQLPSQRKRGERPLVVASDFDSLRQQLQRNRYLQRDREYGWPVWSYNVFPILSLIYRYFSKYLGGETILHSEDKRTMGLKPMKIVDCIRKPPVASLHAQVCWVHHSPRSLPSCLPCPVRHLGLHGPAEANIAVKL